MLVPSLITALGRWFATAGASGTHVRPVLIVKLSTPVRAKGPLAPRSPVRERSQATGLSRAPDTARLARRRIEKSTGPVMLADRRSLSAQLVSFARSKGVSIARDPWQGDEMQADAVGYSREELIAREIKSHREAIALYESEASSPDEQVRMFAQVILPQLQKHLAMLESLKSENSDARR